jgi:uncharacterized membrane protein YgcG
MEALEQPTMGGLGDADPAYDAEQPHAYPCLPPTGQVTDDNQGQVISYLTALAEEAAGERQKWVTVADLNERIFIYGDVEPPDDQTILLNDIQGQVVASVTIQGKEPPKVTLEPVETGEEPMYFWAGPDHIGMALGVPPQCMTESIDPMSGEALPIQPMDPMLAGMLLMGEVPEEVSPALMPGQIRPNWIVKVDDNLIARTYQVPFDVLWRRSYIDVFLRNNLLDNNIHGWSFALYEFDEDRKVHVLRQLGVREVFIDPRCRSVQEAEYVMVDLPFDLNAAKQNWPHLAEQLEQAANTGRPQHIDAWTEWSKANARDFKRPIVSLRVAWIRNQPVPVGPEEAVALGYATAVTDPATGEQFIVDREGNELDPMRPGYPTRLGIRQIMQVGSSLVVDDRECETPDIPVLHNVNIPIPGSSPYGMGEPMRQRSIQMAKSGVVDAMVRHAKFFAFPIMNVPQQVLDRLPDEIREAPARPDTVLPWDMETWQATGGKPISFVDPPQMSPALTEVFGVLDGELQAIGGHAPVLQGQTENGVTAARAIEALQATGSSQIAFKAMRLGDMVHHMAVLMLHNIVWRMSVDDLMLIISRYPRTVLEAIHERARLMEWNVNITVQAGNTGLQMTKRQIDGNDVAIGAKSIQTYREDNGIDHDQEERRITIDMMKRAKMAAMLNPQPGPGQESQESGGKNDSKDQGRGGGDRKAHGGGGGGGASGGPPRRA